MNKKQIKEKVQADIIHHAMHVLQRYSDENAPTEQRAEARKQIARIEKLFGFDPYSFL